MTGKDLGTIGTCPGCGKQAYRSRKHARAWARRLHPDAHLSAYRCEVAANDVWHIGHLPPRVIDSVLDRHDLGYTAMRPQRSRRMSA